MKTLNLFVILALSLNPGLVLAVNISPDNAVPVDPISKQFSAAITASCSQTTDKPLNAAALKCAESATSAATWCRSESNPSIHKGILVVGGLLAGIAMMKSMQDSCSKFNDAMKAGQLALTAYTTSCTIVQGQCDSACGAFQTALTNATAARAGVVIDTTVTTCQTQTATLLPQVQSQCSGYKTSLMTAGAGIMSMLQQSGLMGKCEKAVAAVDCLKDPTNSQCPQAMDCSKPENASNSVCICKANPAAPGCGGSYAGNGGGSPGGNGGRPTALDDKAVDVGNFVPTGTDGIISPTGAGATAGGSSLGGGSGGGGGGGGLGGGTGGGKEKEAGKRTGLNANILGGYEGGGGGGGARGGSAANSGFKDYLPGGSKDPNRNVASQGLLNKEVTASGSKSNWEKVSDRYNENRRTLMGP